MTVEKLTINFEIAEDEWRRAAAARHDEEAEPCFDHFYGSVQISFDGRALFPRRYYMSVADLAAGMVELLSDEGFVSGTRTATEFRESDDNLLIEVADEGAGRLSLTTNVDGGGALTLRRERFVEGVEDFVSRFVAAGSEWVDGLLTWSDLSTLSRDDRGET